MEPEEETEGRPRGPRPTPGTGPPDPAPGGGLATPGSSLASLCAYKLPFDLKTEGGSIVFQKEFRSATTRNQDSDPETPFLHPAGTGNLERIIAIIITNASPSTTDVSLIHE